MKIIRVTENIAEMQVAAATITFCLRGDDVVDIVRIPPPRECHVPERIMDFAKKRAKEEIKKERERLKIKSLQTKLPY